MKALKGEKIISRMDFQRSRNFMKQFKFFQIFLEARRDRQRTLNFFSSNLKFNWIRVGVEMADFPVTFESAWVEASS